MNDQNRFLKNCHQYFQGIEICIENKLILPSLTLIYSGIDTFSWVAYGDIGVRERFTKWVEHYMYKEKKLSPSLIDLYAARCAVLHTLTPYSDLSKKKKAKLITYAWGTAKLEKLEKSIELLSISQTTSVHLNELFECFKLGVIYFLETEGDKKECKERISKHFSHLSKDIINTFINSKA